MWTAEALLPQPAVMSRRDASRRRLIRSSTALVLALAVLGPGPSWSQPAGSSAASPSPPRSLMQRLRQFLGLNPPLALGGSRSGDGMVVCLISPWPGGSRQARSGEPQRLVLPTATPTLLSAGPLNELQLLRGNQIVWRQRASSSALIAGPIAWPLQPLQPGEQLQLRLRPRGASGGDFAAITLQAGSAAVLRQHRNLVNQLRATPAQWQAVIDAELPTNPALAVALASDPSAPPAIQAALQEAGGCATQAAP